MKKIATVVGFSALAFLAGCENVAVPGVENSAPPAVTVASVAPDSDASITFLTPVSAYRIEKVTPTIGPDAAIGWFKAGEGSPREVGGFVGSAVIEGLKGRFNGSLPLELEIDIRQFQPVVGIQPYGVDAVHRVKLDMILKDVRTGEEVGRSNNLYMDLVALTGTAAAIAQNAGRTPEVRMRERITQIGGAWAQELTCAEVRCPGPVIAAVPVPTPTVAEPVVAPAPVVAAAPEPVVPAPAPVAVAPSPVVADAATDDAGDEANPISSFFERLTAAVESPVSEPEQAAAVDVAEDTAPIPAPAPAPVVTPAPQHEVVADVAPAEADPVEGFFARLFEADGDDPVDPEPVETAVAPAPEPVAPAPAPVVTAAPEPAPEAEEASESLFSRLFLSDENAEPTAEEAPAVAPAPEVVAAVETAAAAPAAPRAPVVSQDPAPAVAPTPPAPAPVASTPVQDSGVAQQVPPSPAPAGSESAVVAQSPFFRSPAGTVPTLPQQALLGRSQRANDPLRRRAGDVVLEISNLPAFWDGDVTSGGIWVALPYVPAYRRAVVTNPVNGRTVEANLFWRDPQAGGGSTLLSSAAAEALGVAPGQVSNLGVKVVAAE